MLEIPGQFQLHLLVKKFLYNRFNQDFVAAYTYNGSCDYD